MYLEFFLPLPPRRAEHPQVLALSLQRPTSNLYLFLLCLTPRFFFSLLPPPSKLNLVYSISVFLTYANVIHNIALSQQMWQRIWIQKDDSDNLEVPAGHSWGIFLQGQLDRLISSQHRKGCQLSCSIGIKKLFADFILWLWDKSFHADSHYLRLNCT